MTTYPAVFDVSPPPRFERLQLLLRILIAFVLGMVGVTGGWMALLVYIGLPAVAAIVIQSNGAASYLERTAPAIVRVLRWLLSFEAYMLFLTDRFPTGEETLVRYSVTPAGVPTPAGAVWRLLTSIPEVLVLAVLGCISCIVGFLSALTILFSESVPAPFLAYQRGILRWQARLLAYHASLVEVTPPYVLEGGPDPDAAAPR